MSHIIETRKSLNISDYFVESGDLANEIGKQFMDRLWAQINHHKDQGLEEIYFLTSIRKNPTNLKEIHIYIKALRQELHYLRESFDFWKYDYKNDKLKLLWSIPHRTEMKNFLKTPDKYNKDLIKWIKEYIKQEKINLKDSSAQVINS